MPLYLDVQAHVLGSGDAAVRGKLEPSREYLCA